ncbi:hypothetical protein [Paenarthrobacter aurescens]|uniref:hypothetical protein n=1 Tax=Paenarthrobacter aurescens TaxID=43663 RepID=UPI001FEA6B8F|nr:hypothetical protein [Paenarthrobacter aurescens]MDO6143171.1 hypothetical protein [Paenarthrobacter aurescens]MDO6147017.1 hypothetical protein [Paenarthrobacter aurescens]MDO6158263.1 hypothetical protein [Paenarthrobacter aurescens]MDO6162247.1 hypothetical protein [Paenarthrobacter aurescens]
MTEPQHSAITPPEWPAHQTEHPETEQPEPDHSESERPVVRWPEAPSLTGDPLVDKALGLLDGVAGSPVPDHGELYARVHDGLLEALDAEPGLPATPRSTARPEGDS